jgi:tRNA 2-(methylsulfanyl)-N6-isopentenyladenosine37 hydroxylase
LTRLHPQLDGLPLTAPTRPEWVAIASADLDALLIDHAHCELKAASNAMAIAGRYAAESGLVHDMTALAREELRHFEQVHTLVEARGLRLTPPRTDDYVKRLSNLIRGGQDAASALRDQLIFCGFIEARSCERFRLLAEAPIAADLRRFYADLAAAEARHHELFFAHARATAGAAAAEARIARVATLEMMLVSELPLAPRIH